MVIDVVFAMSAAEAFEAISDGDEVECTVNGRPAVVALSSDGSSFDVSADWIGDDEDEYADILDAVAAALEGED